MNATVDAMPGLIQAEPMTIPGPLAVRIWPATRHARRPTAQPPLERVALKD